jgi:hypothetical protein
MILSIFRTVHSQAFLVDKVIGSYCADKQLQWLKDYEEMQTRAQGNAALEEKIIKRDIEFLRAETCTMVLTHVPRNYLTSLTSLLVSRINSKT